MSPCILMYMLISQVQVVLMSDEASRIMPVPSILFTIGPCSLHLNLTLWRGVARRNP